MGVSDLHPVGSGHVLRDRLMVFCDRELSPCTAFGKAARQAVKPDGGKKGSTLKFGHSMHRVALFGDF
jgi:hypothetical protein